MIHIKKILLHAILWFVAWLFYIYFFSYNTENNTYILWFSSLLIPLTALITYLMIYLIIPRFLLTKRYFKFGLYTFYLLIFSAYEIVLILYACLYFILKFDISNMPSMVKNFTFVMILVYLVVGVAAFVHLLNHSFKTTARNKELNNKILETQLQLKEQELDFLKKQIHPHFLFNTLNTIYGFALKQSKQTPDIILKLSNLLDYILYQVNKPKVSLKEEILHIKEYISLEKIRFQDTLKLIFTSDEIRENIDIAPMLLIPFVENAFKHGNLIDGFLRIEINVRLDNKNKLVFSVRNTVFEQNKNSGSCGIGMENIKKRLDLVYKGNYLIDIENKNNWYSVTLTINDLKRFNDE